MTQTVPATAVLGPGKTGLAIGLRVLNLDGTEYAAFATTDVAETSVLGTYRKAGGVVVPDAGGYIVWGVSGTDYAEATVESTPSVPTAGDNATAAAAAILVTPANKLATGATGEASANVTMWKDATAPAMTGDAYARLGAPAGASVSADIAAIAAASAAGSGAISFPVTVNDEDSNPIDGVEVWISTDSAGASVVAGTLSTDALGLATFMLDAGTYYLWRQRSGYNFVNPVTIVVS